ncbi:MAG: hypothetical protein EPN60_16215 [Nevskiaceae bacterium]|nr:MAG: hypothetical protein EPN60_16215 [Nevskiaceae bacterium]
MKHVETPHSTPTRAYELAEVDTFRFPTFFTAVFDYSATGEGRTVGLMMGYAHGATDLRAMVLDRFNPYFGQGAEIWPNLRVPPENESLVPDAVRKIIADPAQILGNFHFAGFWHLNQS